MSTALFGELVSVVLGVLTQAYWILSRMRAFRIWRNGVATEAVVVSSRSIYSEGRSYWANVAFTKYHGLQASAKAETPSKMAEGDRISIVRCHSVVDRQRRLAPRSNPSSTASKWSPISHTYGTHRALSESAVKALYGQFRSAPSGRPTPETPEANLHSPALVAQGIEHRFPKPGVGGSNPPEGATGIRCVRTDIGISGDAHDDAHSPDCPSSVRQS